MKKIVPTILLSLSCLSQPAFSATDTPTPAAAPVSPQKTKPVSDGRIRYYPYNENTVYQLDLHLKSVTALQFSSNEEVQSILIGDSASWEVVKLKSGNVVSVKPIIAAADTNMTIYTDKRVYSFDLRSVGELTPGKPSVFRSVFTYPAERNVRRKPVTPPEPIYTNYLVSGEGSFRPRWVQDNGRQTTFFLPADSPRPAIFKVGADKKEELINSRTVDDRVIVDGTSNFWVLRIGDEMICVGIDYAVKSKPKPVRKTEVLHAQR